jgi:hypothetical protein
MTSPHHRRASARTSQHAYQPLTLCLVLLILTLGSAARVYRLDEKSLWSDEVATIATSQGRSIDPEAYTLHGKQFDAPTPVPASIYTAKALPEHGTANLGDVLNVLRDNVHPPLFFYLSQRWTALRNSLSPGVLREPAALFGILDILFIFWLALQWMKLPSLIPTRANSTHFSESRDTLNLTPNLTPSAQFFDPAPEPADTDRHLSQPNQPWPKPLQLGFALLSSAFMAFSAYQVDHAQDARQYTLLVLLSLLATGIALRQIRNQGRSWASWGLLAILLAAGFYTQYFFGLFIVYIGILLLVLGPKTRTFLTKGLATLALTGALCLPWLPWFKVQLTFVKRVGHYTAGLWNPVRLPEKLWRTACEFFIPDNPMGKWLPLVILLAVAYRIWQTYRNRKNPDTTASTNETPALFGHSPLSPIVIGLLLWLIVIVGGQIGIDLLKHTHTATIRRYLVLVSPACYLLMAYAIASLWHWTKKQWQRGFIIGVTALMLGGMAGDTVDYLFRTHTSSDEFKQAAARINADYRPGDVVLVSKSGAMAVGMALYLRDSIPMLGIDVPNAMALRGNTPLTDKIVQALVGHSRVWLVFSHAAQSTEKHLGKQLEQAGYQQNDFSKVPGVKVLLWKK